ncbi:MAG: Lrp/AsnC family transcriptional regulator, partial [Thermoprotei archaeon]
MDELSRKILRILQKDARTPISEIAHKVGRPRTTVAQRIRRLEDNGVINSYRAIIDPYKVGFRYHAVVMLKV